MLDDADAGKLAIAALVAAAGIAAILVFVLYRLLSAAKRERAEAEKRKQYLPEDQSRYLRSEEPRKSPQLANQRKVEPRLSWEDDDPDDDDLEDGDPGDDEDIQDDVPGEDTDQHRAEPIERNRPPPPARRGFGFGTLTIVFLFGLCIGAFAPTAWLSIGPLSDYLDHLQSIGRLLPSGDSSSPETLQDDAGLPANDLEILRSVRQRLPFEINPGIEMVSVGVVDGFVDAQIKVTRALSENERKLFLLTAIDRSIHTICNVQTNADLKALTENGYDVRVTYVDSADQRIRRDILASPICSDG